MAFTKGKSGNPAGRPTRKAMDVETAMTMDGWMSMITGIGTALYDKRMSATVVVEPVGDEEAQAIYRSDDMGARCIDIRPKEMFREGFGICISELAPDKMSEELTSPDAGATSLGGGPAGIGMGMYNARAGAPVGTPRLDARRIGARRYDRAWRMRLDAQAARAQDIAERAFKKFEALDTGVRTISKFQQAMSYASAYGGGGLLIGARDGSDDWSKPLREERVRSIDFLTTLEPREMTPIAYYEDPLAAKYGEVMLWQLTPTAPNGAASYTRPIYVHETRVIYFPGIEVARNQPSLRIGHGDSVFTRVKAVLRDFNIGWSAASIILNEFSLATMSIENLAEMVSTNDRKKLLARMAAVQLARSVAKVTLIDTKEKFTRDSASVAGLADLLERLMQRLAAAFDVPVTILMGVSPSGLNATGASDIRSWYDDIASEQKKVLGPRLRRLIGLIIRSMNGGREPSKWSIDFAPLWQESAKEKADTRFVDAQTDEKNIINGLYTAEEARRSRYGGDKYGTEITIEHADGYEPTDEDLADYTGATPPGGAPPAGGAPPGGPTGGGMEPAKVTSLMGVITAVAAGTLPRANAIGVLRVAFGFDAATAELLLPEEGSAPTPEGTPPGGGSPDDEEDEEDEKADEEDDAADAEDDAADEEDEKADAEDDAADEEDLTVDWDENQERDELGRFGSGGGSGGGAKPDKAKVKAEKAVERSGKKLATAAARVTRATTRLTRASAREERAQARVDRKMAAFSAQREKARPLRDASTKADAAHAAAKAAAQDRPTKANHKKVEVAARRAHAAERKLVAHDVAGDKYYARISAAHQARDKAAAAHGKAIDNHARVGAAHAKLLDEHRENQLAVRGRDGTHSVIAGGFNGHTLTPDAQRALRDHHKIVLREHGIHDRPATAGGTVNVKPVAEMIGALGMAHGDGAITIRDEVARGIVEHGKHDPKDIGQAIKLYGKGTTLDYSKAYGMLSANHTMVHEQIHQSGPRFAYVGHGVMAEEMATEMAARGVGAKLHDIPSDQAGYSYGNYIDPTLVKLRELSDRHGGNLKTQTQTHDALVHAATEHKKGDNGKLIYGEKVLQGMAAAALNKAGVSDPTVHHVLFYHMLSISMREQDKSRAG